MPEGDRGESREQRDGHVEPGEPARPASASRSVSSIQVEKVVKEPVAPGEDREALAAERRPGGDPDDQRSEQVDARIPSGNGCTGWSESSASSAKRATAIAPPSSRHRDPCPGAHALPARRLVPDRESAAPEGEAGADERSRRRPSPRRSPRRGRGARLRPSRRAPAAGSRRWSACRRPRWSAARRRGSRRGARAAPRRSPEQQRAGHVGGEGRPRPGCRRRADACASPTRASAPTTPPA